jgi:hypothetical protein
MFRLITYLVKLVKGVKPTSDSAIYQKSIRRDLCIWTRRRRKTSITDLEYCCISIMHHSLRHATFTTTTISVENGSSVQEKLAKVNWAFPFDSRWKMNQPTTVAQWIQVLPNSCKFKQCSTTLLIPHLETLTAHQQL